MKLPPETIATLAGLADVATGDLSPLRFRSIASALESVADLIRLAVIIETTPDFPSAEKP